MPDHPRIYLSDPHMGTEELDFVREAFETNWIAPLGPHVDGFEAEFTEKVGASHAVAVSSGTAALHLALILAGVEPGDEVFVSDFTFVASVNPIRYVGAEPVLIDSERTSWNMDPDLLEEALEDRARTGTLPAAVVLVHLYGQTADLDRVSSLCERHQVPLIEDAAEALGATHRDRNPGTVGSMGIFSFNGNKIITTSGGGMLVTEDEAAAERARKLASQAREPARHYEHEEVGYNYRLSNVLAGIGRGQLRVLDQRVAARRRNFDFYREALGSVPGVSFMPEAEWGTHSRWLTCLLLDAAAGITPDRLCERLEQENIELRPLWKPMHLQPLYRDAPLYGGSVSEELFERGVCLPSGSRLDDGSRRRIASELRSAIPSATP